MTEFATRPSAADPVPGSPPAYPDVPAQVDLPALDHQVLDLWRERDIFAKSLANTANGQPWTFYEGPPTANGHPGIHHVEPRVFKDLFPRFETMRGRYVERKGGWDCQGLHVEVEVEKAIGVSGKPDIERYGIAEFNAKCRESAQAYIGEQEVFTTRMGYWVDMTDPYRTMDRPYIESVWWSLQRIFDQGLLKQDFRITPYCPRCGTGLSDHEVAQGYESVVDPSVYVRMPLTSGPLAGRAALLVWTTTPWTLVSNTAVAVHPDVTYVAATDGTETLVVAEPLFEQVLGEGWRITERYTGTELEHWRYDRPFDLVAMAATGVGTDPAGADPGAHYVVVDGYVTTEDGTGLVHQAPAFGADDYRVARSYGLPIVNPIQADGRFAPDVPLVGGAFFKDADADLVADLRARGVLFDAQDYEHSYPHCWRCHTPLLYYALPAWYIRTTAIKDALLAQNELTTWYPETVKWGRYGDWLANNVDWALSRSRYWGTPLPIWRCAADHLTCVGSVAELEKLSGRDLAELDPHRPYVDEIRFGCPEPGCAEEAQRVPDVIDAWFDSGAMPFAQWGYPWAAGSAERFERAHPAQFICEAIDQTRGWFYTLMAIGTLVFGRSPYESVVCVGHLLAEDGRKMSKHLGNIIEPIPLMERHGADAVRWFMACSGSPWAARRVGDQTLDEVVRKVILTYWNTAAFHALYARLAGWVPGSGAPDPAERPVLDRWLRSRSHRLVRDATAAYEAFDTQRLGQLIGGFVDELSNWYVRRSRRRFWNGDPAAFATLHESLRLLTTVLAPLTPFVTERVWQDLVRSVEPDAPESVHLARWPVADDDAVDDTLAAQVAVARRIVELGRAARAQAKVRTRQPLARALVGARDWSGLPAPLRQEVAEELNVLELAGLGEAGQGLVEYAVKPNFRALGRRFGNRTPLVARAVTEAEPEQLAGSLRTGVATVVVDGERVELDSDEVTVSERPREGWAVANAHGETVALDLTVTDELRRAGLAREVIRLVQEARKTSGFAVSDRIDLWWSAASEDGRAALREHGTVIAGDVLAVEIREGAPEGAAADRVSAHGDDGTGVRFWIRRHPAADHSQ